MTYSAFDREVVFVEDAHPVHDQNGEENTKTDGCPEETKCHRIELRVSSLVHVGEMHHGFAASGEPRIGGFGA